MMKRNEYRKEKGSWSNNNNNNKKSSFFLVQNLIDI